MASVINTNIQSLTAQRNLSTSQNSLSTSMQRLSSGLRINSAKDDAAGLAISERMTTQIRGLNQAGRNANDGISLAQTAEGALGTIGNNLQRIRELAVQSRNATNSSEDRAALQKEVAQLKSEVDRVASDTSFNGTKLLDGSFTSKAFQVGANAGETISIDSVVDANVNKLGSSYQITTAGKLTAPTTPAAAAGDSAAFALVTAGDLKISVDGGAAIDLRALDAVAVKTASGSATDLASANKAAVQQRLQDVASAISEATSGRVTATVENDGGLTIRSLSTFTFSGTGSATTTAVATDAGVLQQGLKDVDISTVQGADDAIIRMDGALQAVNSARADLGAIQNRFEAIVSNLAVNSENLSASRSRIMDADFAQETANLSRSQILQQAGTAMVAQANQLPQNVLKLLQ